MEEIHEWVTMSKGAKEIGFSVSKLSVMARNGEVETIKDPRDKRVVLVNLVELRRKFPKIRRG